MDVTRRPADRWIVDFDRDMVRKEATLYKAPYRHAQEHVYPMRQRSRCESCRERWWRHVEPRQGMRRAPPGALALHRDADGGEAPAVRPARRAHLPRPSTDRHRPRRRHHLRHPAQPLPRGVVAAARHQPGRPPALHPTTTFETFPFPDGLSPDIAAADYAEDPRATSRECTEMASACRKTTSRLRFGIGWQPCGDSPEPSSPWGGCRTVPAAGRETTWRRCAGIGRQPRGDTPAPVTGWGDGEV